MKKYKFQNFRKILLTALLSLFTGCAVTAYGIWGAQSASALTALPETATAGVLYDFAQDCYSEKQLNELAKQVLNAVDGAPSGRTFTDLIWYAQNTAGKTGKPVKSDSITVGYGRYRFSTSATSDYRDLFWMPVYVSTTKGGDAVLTLYLSATIDNNSTISAEEISNFSNQGYYSTNTSHAAPANMYGMSWLRAFQLGNGGDYTRHLAKGNATTGGSTLAATVRENSTNKYNDFIRYTELSPKSESQKITGAPTGVLYEDIATPSEMEWQATESAVDWLAGTDYDDYCWPNEAYAAPANGSYYLPDYFDYSAKNKTNYDIWQYDKVWLPSLTEVGTGDSNPTDGDTRNGIWKLTNEQRANSAPIGSWLRTAANNAPKLGTGDQYSTYTMYGMDYEGNVTTFDVDNQNVGIRPAIHLNLSKIVAGNKTVPRVNLPDEIHSEYCGAEQTIDTIPADQKTWFLDGKMERLQFYSDEACEHATRPINAGTYYVVVQLSDSNIYFKGEEPSKRWKSTKFIVDKKKIYVTWNYENPGELNSPPTGVNIEGSFYQVDIDVNNVPKIGMMYSDVSGSGIIDSREYPDQVGYYTAKAYIIDEEYHKYNYELAEKEGYSLTSKQFYVDKKQVDVPYFIDNGSTESLTVPYKGKQFIQIANVTKYVKIEISVASNSVSVEEAKNKLQDLGVVNDVQTYVVESVATYTFTLSLTNQNHSVWADNGSWSSRNMELKVEKAPITVSFVNLPSSWASATKVEFDLNVIGTYSTAEAENLQFTVQYYAVGSFNPIEVGKDPTSGKYVFRANTLAAREYYIYVEFGGTSGYTGNYKMDTAVTQKFTVVETVSKFSNADVTWQYRLNGVLATETYSYNEHAAESSALQLDYVEGGFYEFSLTLDEDTLKGDPYFVRATYTGLAKGDTYVTNAGLHCVIVTIGPYDKNVIFTEQTYKIYFRIKESKFDISNVKWDYTAPFVYSGNEHKVKIDPDTLPEGLSVEYVTGGVYGNGRTNANIYTTVVRFKVSDEYALNYMTPDANDPNSYINDGDFSFSLLWEIEKYEIDAVWVTDDPNGNLFFIPYLYVGNHIATYTFERLNGSTYEPCETITSTSTDQTYRITATVSSAYSQNYAFTGNTTYEFTVAAGQYALSVFVKVDGVKSDDGETFVYKGEAYEVTPEVWDSAVVTITSYTVDYYPVTSGVKGAKLTEAPKDVGTYVAVISANLKIGGSDFTSETEFNYEIIKADLDLSALKWEYVHNGTVMTAYYDVDQGKFIDDSGKEAVFAFEYDGTLQEIHLVGEDETAGITIDGISNNSFINADSYTATVDWTYDTLNFNEPSFPSTFDWSITPARIDFANVEWGYVDADGVEHKFGSAGAKFDLMRGEDKKAVKYTVALINLPDYVKHMFSYSTTSYTIYGFGTKEGSSFAMAGEYLTEVKITGTYTDPTGNRESFTANDFPFNIAKSVDWEIVDKELSIPEFDESWTVFDNKTHNLLEICGIPEDELNYFRIEITFVNNFNVIDNAFTGYDGVPFEAFDAGNYIIRFYKFDDEDAETYYIWGQVDFTVERGELTVTWDHQGQIPVARVSGVYVSDRLVTKYYTILSSGERGAEVDVAYIKLTSDVKYVAVPTITDAYANNLVVAMDGDEPEEYVFTYIQIILSPSAKALAIPKIANDPQEYTGSVITFTIADWQNYYSTYLYIIEGEEALKQIEVGVYHVSVAFKSGAEAYWDTSSYDDPDLSTKVLTFEITPPKNIKLEYPQFASRSVEYSGMPVTFTITNWMIIQDYVEYEVTYRGVSLGKNIPLTFTNAGIYIVRFYFPEGSIGYWGSAVDATSQKKDYNVQLSIYDPDNPNLLYPEIVENAKPYTGLRVEFTVDNWDGEVFAFANLPDGVDVDGNKLYATAIKEYTVTVKIIKADIFFDDGTTECTLTFRITAPPGGDIKVPLPVPEFDKLTATLTGSSVTFTIKNWAELGYGNYIVLSSTVNSNITISGGTVTITAAGTYPITIRFLGENATWEDGTTAEKTYSLVVNAAGSNPGTNEPGKIITPVFTKSSYEFTGRGITFTVAGWNGIPNGVTVEVYDATGKKIEGGLTQKYVGVYTAVFKIDSSKATWTDGSTDNVTLTFEIKKATLHVETDENGNPVIKNNKPVVKNGDGEEVDYEDYFDATFTDPETGETVPPDQLQPGKEYDVSFTVKEDKRSEFESSVNNSSQIEEKLKETYHIVYVKENGGIPWWVWLIVGGAVLLILIIILIVVLGRRNSDGGGNNGGGYDDGGYDDDDYDDEDYDDEDYDDDDYDDDYDDDDDDYDYDDEGYDDEYDDEYDDFDANEDDYEDY